MSILFGYTVVKQFVDRSGVVTNAEPIMHDYTDALNKAKDLRSKLNRYWKVSVCSVEVKTIKELK